MISNKGERPLKEDKDYNLYYSNEIAQLKECIDNLLQIIIKDNENFQNSVNNIQKNLEEYQFFCKQINLQKINDYKIIIKRKNEYITSIENNINKIGEYIHKIDKIFQKINYKMNNEIPNPEFNPPNCNSFNISSEVNSSESNNNSQMILNEEDNGAYCNIYGNDSSININSNINNNKKKSIFDQMIEKSNNNNINNNNIIIKVINCLNKNNIQRKNEEEKNINNNELKINELEIYKGIKVIDNSFISDDDYSLENEKEYNKFCNNFYFVIHLIEKKNFKVINEIDFFLKKIIQKVNIKENNIFFSFENRNSFIETFIKSSKFSSFSIEEIQKEYPYFNKLYEYKMVYDNILDNKTKLDYKGNTINPNSSYNIYRGTELYDPPYGWLGIGLNVNEYKDKDWLYNKTNKSKWAIAYYGIGHLLSYKLVKAKLNNILLNKKIKTTQRFKDYFDKRHSNNKVGEGICLTPKIKFAENYSGILLINGKRYKVVLMAKVLIEKIRELNDIDLWILNRDEIRFYRILLKEVNYENFT